MIWSALKTRLVTFSFQVPFPEVLVKTVILPHPPCVILLSFSCTIRTLKSDGTRVVCPCELLTEGTVGKIEKNRRYTSDYDA